MYWERSETSRTQKHCFVYTFLLFMLPEQNKPRHYNYFTVFIIPEHKTILLECLVITYQQRQIYIYIYIYPTAPFVPIPPPHLSFPNLQRDGYPGVKLHDIDILPYGPTVGVIKAESPKRTLKKKLKK